MRVIQSEEITEKVAKMCIEANCFLNDDIKNAMEEGVNLEESETGKSVLKSLLENAEIAREKENRESFKQDHEDYNKSKGALDVLGSQTEAEYKLKQIKNAV